MIDARWIDLGELEPLELHASYTGLAEAQADEAPPILAWVIPKRPHLSIGASQSAFSELDLERCCARGVPVIRRPLGGGNVWIDAEQPCLFVVLPHAHRPRGHTELFTRCLEPLVEVYRRFGLQARRVGDQDLWVGARKILGSGAATVARSMVFGTSFLLRFDARAFAALIRCETEGYREWLNDLLGDGITDWRREGVEPEPAELARHLRTAFEDAWGWRLTPSTLRGDEVRAVGEAKAELEEPLEDYGRRYVPYGIKVNANTYLVEGGPAGDRLRLVLRGGLIDRIWHEQPDPCARLQGVLGCRPGSGELRRRLIDSGMDQDAAEGWIGRIGMLGLNTGN